MNPAIAAGHDDPLDNAVVAYLEAVEAGQTPDRAAYPELSGFFTDVDAVKRWTAALRQAAPPSGAASDDPDRTTGYQQAPPSVVTSFGDYEILQELGRGGMGVVYKARHVKFQRLVALKMILAGPYAGPELQGRFLTEARAVARLQHPNIVQIYEIGAHDGLPYVSLEYVEGGSLADRLKGPPPSDKEAAQLIEVLARAAHHAHGRGIVHRDLKPANVMLTGGGVPKIADFGLAKFLGGDSGPTHSGDVLGTASYMAPEQASGKVREIGPAADVYALGAILYELLTGRPPFRAATLLATLRLVEEQPPQRPRVYNPRVDPALEAICLKCLEKTPAERYASAEALADDLAAFVRGESVHAERGVARRLLGTVLRQSRYTEVMVLWSGVWMGMAVLYFLISVAKSLLIWGEIEEHGPYFAIWAAGVAVLAVLVWLCRLRRGPPLMHVERQLAQLWLLFWVGFFLTAWQYQRTGGPVTVLLPILMLEAALAFGCTAAILGGSFYVLTAVSLVTAVLEALWPSAGPLITAAGTPALFWLGWKYSRRMPPR
jgi:serine/threonine-protein kinase